MRGEIRIIGGKLRGRKLQVLTDNTIRPTKDSIRETLFNWLLPAIEDSHCLDAFAGSGALGIEALSRGALHVVFTDCAHTAIKQLQENLAKLNILAAEVYQACVPNQLKRPEKLFDIVFLDPPFTLSSLGEICHFLEEKNFLAPYAHIYLETKNGMHADALPINWEILKSKKAGGVIYQLARRKN